MLIQRTLPLLSHCFMLLIVAMGMLDVIVMLEDFGE